LGHDQEAMMNANAYDGDRRQAQEELRALMDLAVRYLGTAQLDALSLTIAAYLDGRGERVLTRLIDEQLASERMQPLPLARLH
jgi:hypothetical protein